MARRHGYASVLPDGRREGRRSSGGSTIGQLNKPRLLGIDLTRIFAAFAVMVFHIGYASWAYEHIGRRILGDSYRYPELAGALMWGRYGVEIFFTVSGFVIAFSASETRAWGFLRSRMLRLLPGAFVCASITLVFAAIFDPRPVSELLRGYANMVALGFGTLWLDTVYWTLFIEVVFYAVIFLMLAIRGFAAIDYVALAITLLSAAAHLTFVSLHPGHVIAGRVPQLLLLTHGVFFGAGVFLWLLIARGPTLLRIAGFFIAVVVGIGAISLGARTPLPAAIYALAVAFIWFSVRADAQIAARLPLPVAHAIRALGLATYPIYLLHNVVGVSLLRIFSDIGLERFTALTLSVLAIVALALGVTFTAERGVRMLLARALPASPPPRNAEAV